MCVHAAPNVRHPGGRAFPHVSQYGHMDQVASVSEAVRAVKKWPEHVVGVKVLLTAAYANDGQTEFEVYKRALA